MYERYPAFQPLAGKLVKILLATLLVMTISIGREFTGDARQAVFGQREIQIYVPYSGLEPIHLPPVLLIAHNAGDQQTTARKALDHKAAGIEIDVRAVTGVLYATHSAPPELMPMRIWRAPQLHTAWNYTDGAQVIKFDLKSTDWPALESLIRFVEDRPSERQILISSNNIDALVLLDTALPGTLGFLSLSSVSELDALFETPGRVAGIEGISIPQWLLGEERIQQITEHGYLIDAWTVNDVSRLVELATAGVDVITTDNLAFFDMAVDTDSESVRSK